MAGSSSTMAMRRDIAGDYSPSPLRRRRLPRDCQNCSAPFPHSAALPPVPCLAMRRHGIANGSAPMHEQTQSTGTWRISVDLTAFVLLAAIAGMVAAVTLASIALVLSGAFSSAPAASQGAPAANPSAPASVPDAPAPIPATPATAPSDPDAPSHAPATHTVVAGRAGLAH